MAISTCLAPEPVLAQSRSISVSIPDNIYTLFPRLVAAAANHDNPTYTIGAVMRFKQFKDNPAHIPIGTPIPGIRLIMSCPIFIGEGTQLGEDTCIWTSTQGHWTKENAIHTNGGDMAFGGQIEFAPGWFLGGVLNAGRSWSDDEIGGSSEGRNVDVAAVVKRISGPWSLSAAIGFSTASRQISRLAQTLGGNPALMTSSVGAVSGGMRLRGAYEFPFRRWYIRPRADLDVAYMTYSGLQETGPAPAIAIDAATKATAGLSPAIEVGGRYDIGPMTILRPYVSLGLIYMPDSSYPMTGNIAGIPFHGTVSGPHLLAVGEAGVHLYQVKGWEMKLDYRITAADSFRNQLLSMRAAWHF